MSQVLPLSHRFWRGVSGAFQHGARSAFPRQNSRTFQKLERKKRCLTKGMASANNGDQESTKAFDVRPPKSAFCRKCGANMIVMIPEGDDKERDTCSKCNYVDYFNPKMVVGCIVEHEEKILMCRRGIEPCKGLWTLPAGYLEMNESTRDGALRETLEEANAAVKIISPYAYLDVPVISQTHIMFRAVLNPPYEFSPGPETLETRFFAPNEIPFETVAFSTVTITLKKYLEDLRSGSFRIHHAEVVKVPGTHPNDMRNHKLAHHFEFHTSTKSQQ
ncbi:hypothetical protein BSKO_12898 [Bryopsis sp. KO-2023]|nr:hypothetical protein BSKO_12898 [Bryopsis sp. KO-2023]